MYAQRAYPALALVFLAACSSPGTGMDAALPDGGALDAASGDAGADATTADLGPDMAMPHGDVHGFVVDHWIVPTSAMRTAIDVDGDGAPDNQFGQFLSAFQSQGLDVQASIDGAVANGDGLELIGVQTTDATLTADDPVGTTFEAAMAHPAPILTGGGSFTVDPSVTPITFVAALVAHDFQSAPFTGPGAPPRLVLSLAPFGGTPTPLAVDALEVHFVTTATSLTSGAVYGFISEDEVQSHLLPAFAAAMDARVTADPTGPTSMTLLSLFDNGGASGSCSGAVAHDGHITICEVTTNSLLLSLTAPDVQMHDAAGAFHPTPHGATPDALSFGLGFTAAQATF